MEDSYVQGVITAYFQSYRIRNLETKDIHQSSCEDGVTWAWLLFGECLLTPAHKIGYLFGSISLLLLAVGCLLMACTQVRSGSGCQWRLLVATFVVNGISFAGAVLSLQIMLLISYDMITTGITVLIMLAVALRALVIQCWGRRKYQTVCNIQNRTTTTPTQRTIEMTSHKIYCVPLSLGITSLLTVVYVTVITPMDLKEDKQQTFVDDSQVQGLQHQELLRIVGSVTGCVACLGRLWIEIIIVSRFLREIQTNRVWKGGGVMIVTSNMLYIIGVILQSGSFRVTIVTLPWLIGRAVQCCFQMFTQIPSTLLQRSPVACDRETNNKPEENTTNDLEAAVTLLGSSESDESNSHVLFDRSWSDTGKVSAHLPPKEAHSSLPESHTSTGADDVTTTTDTDLSSTNQEHELTWEDGFTSFRIPAPIDLTTASKLRLQRLSLASQIESLSRTSSETSDQRVRSWISQSTPEEECSSCLTFTLNLDSTHDSVFSNAGENFGNRKCNLSSSFPLSQRKNSF